MTSRYRTVPGPRGVNRIVHDDVVAVLGELTTLERQAADVRDTALEVKQRAHGLKLRLLADNRRRRAFTPERPPRPPDALLCSSDDLTRARWRAGLSQRELGAHLGIHRSAIAEAERGARPPGPRLNAWALGVLRAAVLAGEPAADAPQVEGSEP